MVSVNLSYMLFDDEITPETRVRHETDDENAAQNLPSKKRSCRQRRDREEIVSSDTRMFYTVGRCSHHLRDTRVRAADALDSRPTPSSREVAAPPSPVRSRDEPRARAPPPASSRFFPGGGGNNDPLTYDRRRCEASLLPRRRRWSRRSRSASRSRPSPRRAAARRTGRSSSTWTAMARWCEGRCSTSR